MINRMLLCAAALCAMLCIPAGAGQNDPIRVLIITGDHGHDWKATTPVLKDVLGAAGMQVDVTETPAKDLTSENLSQYDVLLLNYKDTPSGPPESRWSEENRRAFADAVRGGKGLFVYHFASSAFVKDEPWSAEYEKIIAGGWRKQGYHGKRHEYNVTIKDADHPITRGLSGVYPHANDELYQNSVIPEGSTVLVTAWSDKKKDPKNTDRYEPMVWVNTYGKGRVCENVLGHDVAAMQSPIFRVLLARGVEWAATGDAKTPVPDDLKNTSAER